MQKLSQVNESVELLSILWRIDKKLSAFLAEKKMIAWLGASDIIKVTGWSAYDMYRMRKFGEIEFKRME